MTDKPTDAPPAHRVTAFDLVSREPWAITPDMLHTIAAIARRENDALSRGRRPRRRHRMLRLVVHSNVCHPRATMPFAHDKGGNVQHTRHGGVLCKGERAERYHSGSWQLKRVIDVGAFLKFMPCGRGISKAAAARKLQAHSRAEAHHPVTSAQPHELLALWYGVQKC